MTVQSTIDELIEMRLSAMAEAFRTQLNDRTFGEISFEDRFAMLVDVEYSSRKKNRLKRLIHDSGLANTSACIADINYGSGRKLNRGLINNLAGCGYISEFRNIFITGATGSGKTYLACAFGMAACKQFYTVKYVRVPDLLLEFRIAGESSSSAFAKAVSKYTKPSLLILDEWLLLQPTYTEEKELFELINARTDRASTIFCSQYRETDWYRQLSEHGSPLTDALMDRISHNSYKIAIETLDPTKDISMREVYGLSPKDSQ